MYQFDRNPSSRYAAEMARRREIANSRCRPGERWLPSIGKCAGIGGGSKNVPDISIDNLQNGRGMGELAGMSSNEAVKQEIMARKQRKMG